VDSFVKVDNLKLRKVICAAIAQIVKDDVEVLVKPVQRYLSPKNEGRWFVLRNIAHILGLTNNPDSLRILRHIVAHPHKRVRAEALRAAAKFRMPASRDIVVRALKDPEQEIRLVAFDLAPEFRDEEIVSTLSGMVRDKAFREADPGEQRALAVTLARAAGEAALPVLTELLTQRAILGLKRANEVNVAAAAGIRAIGTPPALQALRDIAAQHAHLAEIIDTVLKEAPRA
jgi:HEAT repeat protein